MEKIVFLDHAALSGVPLRQLNFPHSCADCSHNQIDQVEAHLNGATIAMTNRVPISASTLSACPMLRLIAVSATGYDHLAMTMSIWPHVTLREF